MRTGFVAALFVALRWHRVLPQVIDYTVSIKVARNATGSTNKNETTHPIDCFTPIERCQGVLTFACNRTIQLIVTKPESGDQECFSQMKQLIGKGPFHGIEYFDDDSQFNVSVTCFNETLTQSTCHIKETFAIDSESNPNFCERSDTVKCLLRSSCSYPPKDGQYVLMRGPCVLEEKYGDSAMRVLQNYELDFLDRKPSSTTQKPRSDPSIANISGRGVCLSLLGMAVIAGPISVLIVGLGVGIGIVISRRPSEDISVMPPPTCIEASPAAVPNASTTQTTEFPHNTDVEHESPSRDNTTSTVATSMTKREEEPSAPFQQPVPRIPNEEHNVSLTKIFTTTNLPVVSEAKPHTKYDN